ncbi:MAG: hypothetical protein A2Z08_03275 [Deltaproteobacteria bacterium RBG_16_54_11]|nr:MAG: hypothetical protein A2Z08_03275 [Deltaproteobacteria bacterium RBG_16_54_11]
MRKLIVSSVIAVLLLVGFSICYPNGCPELIGRSFTGKKSIELASLIKTLTWGGGTELSSLPVIWKKRTQQKSRRRGDPASYSYDGEVLVTVKGRYLKDSDGKPVEWWVARGWDQEPNAGSVYLGTSYCVADLLADFLDSRPGMGTVDNLMVEKLLAPEGITCRLVKCPNNAATSGLRVYKISINGKRTVWLVFEWSGGSGGDSLEFHILTSKSDVDRIQCDDED